MTTEQKPLTATHEQFRKIVLRWMDHSVSGMPEAHLVAATFAQAWLDGDSFFFSPASQPLQFWCAKVGLNPERIADAFQKHNRRSRFQKGLK
jgi:hypothetical protein